MSSFEYSGWAVYFHPLFAEQLEQQISLVRKLKSSLDAQKFVQHPEVKLLQALRQGIRSKIPLDPFAAHFRLRRPLQHYCRLKKMGLPERYRLFFRASTENDRQRLVVLWLGFPRREGAKDDCYVVFTKMVERGTFPSSIDELISLSSGEMQGF